VVDFLAPERSVEAGAVDLVEVEVEAVAAGAEALAAECLAVVEPEEVGRIFNSCLFFETHLFLTQNQVGKFVLIFNYARPSKS
jgi:hypothetical protein